MLIGRVGLAKMGADMRERIRSAGDEVTGHGHTSNTRDVASLEKLVAALPTPRIVWVMVSSAAATTETLTAMGDLLSQGEVAVDGGSSTFADDIMHAQELQAKGIGFADCGASGGLWGQENGYGLMCGADARHVQMAMPIFDAPRPKSPRDEFGGHVVTQAGESCVLTHH
jgi:6-phosphogluconate dehydrogenase